MIAEPDWGSVMIYRADQMEEYTGMMEDLLRKSPTRVLTINYPLGEPEHMTGVFAILKSLYTDLFTPEFRGWHPFIVGVIQKDGDRILDYLQPHPLSVIKEVGTLVYAPWANPHLPSLYRPECKRRYPNKLMAFEMMNVTGDFRHDSKIFAAAIEGSSPQRGDKTHFV